VKLAEIDAKLKELEESVESQGFCGKAFVTYRYEW
jgi:hypothetical protein